jgi:hypothetical protein
MKKLRGTIPAIGRQPWRNKGIGERVDPAKTIHNVKQRGGKTRAL